MTIETRRFNGSLMHENIYRQTGLPEVDAAWEALGTECTFPFMVLLYLYLDHIILT